MIEESDFTVLFDFYQKMGNILNKITETSEKWIN